MFRFSNSLNLRFSAALGGATLLVMTAAFAGYLGVISSVAEFERVTGGEIRHERLVSGMVSGFKKQVQEWKNVLLRGYDPKQLDKYWGKFQKQEASLQETGRVLSTEMPASPARDLLEQFNRAHAEMGVAYRKGYQAFVDAGFDPKAGDKAVKGIDRAPTKLLEEAATLIAAQAEVATGNALQGAAQAAAAAVAGGVVALLIGVLAAWWLLNRSVLKPTGRVAAALDRLAAGDFRVELDWQSNDELGRLADSTRRIRDDLGALLRELVDTAGQLGQTSEHLAELGGRNREQLGHQHEGTALVATASEELAASAREVASGAAGAAESATAATAETGRGRTVVRAAEDVMHQLDSDVQAVGQTLGELASRSAAIGNVLDVIRGIAEQTNLLALNAAIEAARAGDQGRGFAVVADEVRSLAQRTQASTQEIQATIEQLQAGSRAAVQAMEQGQARVGDGVASTREAGEALDAIAAAVDTIVQLNSQIATAAEQQGVTAGDLSRNVTQIDQSSEQLLGDAERLAASGEQIATLSTTLIEATRRFQL